MANLAAEVAGVLLMHQDVILPGGDGDVTGFAARFLHAIIAVVGRDRHVGLWAFVARLAIVWLAVHLVAVVAVYTGHASLAEVNVGH